MKLFFSALLIISALAANATPTNAPALIELRDQFDVLQKLSFPTKRITLLTIADKKGLKQIDRWLEGVKQRCGAWIDIRGIADVSSVPGPLQGLVQKKFRKVQSHSVMMDWSGDVVKSFSYSPGAAHILVLDRGGQILQRMIGEANERAIQAICEVIERALAAGETKFPSPKSP